ncbi:hypothetical protein KIL84_003101, partial [Mauremys mutica]
IGSPPPTLVQLPAAQSSMVFLYEAGNLLTPQPCSLLLVALMLVANVGLAKCRCCNVEVA